MPELASSHGRASLGHAEDNPSEFMSSSTWNNKNWLNKAQTEFINISYLFFLLYFGLIFIIQVAKNFI